MFSPADPATALIFVNPDLEVIGVDMVRDLLRVAAGDTPTVVRSLSERQFKLLIRHRVTPLIPDHWQVPEPFAATTALGLQALHLQLERCANETCNLLRLSGIDSLVLKGMATSVLDYHSAGQRHSGDVDLLVKQEELRLATDVLEAHGFEQKVPHQFDDDLEKGIALRSEAGLEIDLHTRFSYYARGDVDDLFRSPIEFGSGLRAPSRSARLTHAATHLFYSSPQSRRLSGLADISAIRSRIEDLYSLHQTSELLDLQGPTGYALLIEAALFGRSVDDLKSFTPPTRLARAAFGRPRRFAAVEQLHRLETLETLSDKKRFLHQKLFPSQAFLNERGGRFGYARRAFGPVRPPT